MNTKPELLEVVNENDEVIGLEPRKTIHEKGLLHREIHVWFITPVREIVFQHRAKNKDTYPDKLDSTVGGHVEPGMTYEETVIKEALEETGMKLDRDKLKLVEKVRAQTIDKDTGAINTTFDGRHAYLFEGNIEDLKVEAGNGVGFEAWKIDSLYSLSPENKDKFIPINLTPEFLEFFERAADAIIP